MPMPQPAHAQHETTRARKGNPPLSARGPRRAWAFLREWFPFIVLPALLAGAALVTIGCRAIQSALTKPATLPGQVAPPDPNDPSFPFIGWLAAACIAAGVVSLVASFTPWLAFFPRKSSVAAIGAGVALYLVQGILVKFFGAAVWAVAIAATAVAVVGGIPWVIAFVRWSIDRAGTKLAAKGHRDAAVALKATARGLTGESEADKNERKKLAAKLTGAAA